MPPDSPKGRDPICNIFPTHSLYESLINVYPLAYMYLIPMFMRILLMGGGSFQVLRGRVGKLKVHPIVILLVNKEEYIYTPLFTHCIAASWWSTYFSVFLNLSSKSPGS